MTAAADARGVPSGSRHQGPSTLAVSVHGGVGVLDLVVPDGASARDVVVEYARQSGRAAEPLGMRVVDGAGREVLPAASLGEAGIRSGAVLVLVGSGPPEIPVGARVMGAVPNHRSAGVALAGLCAALFATLCAAAAIAGALDPALVRLVVILLVGGAVLAVLPIGAPSGAVVAPVFAGAGALVSAADPDPARWPMAVGVAALGAAIAAALGAALNEGARDVLRVVALAGAAVFLVAGAGAVLGLHERVVWAVVLVLAMVAARVTPALAVRVPDQTLLDIDRLAVSAWSARSRSAATRTGSVVTRAFAADVLSRGSRVVTAAAAAVAIVTFVAAPLVVRSSELPLDRVGAPVLVASVGGAQLMLARSYRHAYARWFLRACGAWCLGVVVLAVGDRGGWGQVAVVSVVLGVGAVAVAVALGRGWRSPRWSRRADVVEAVLVALSLPALVVTVGLFRRVWELVD